jgi:predicted nucleic acid-binding protein
MTYLDTNIFLRYVTKTRGEKPKTQACFELFQQVKKGEIVVTTCKAVICEILFIIRSPRQYNFSHEDAVARVRPLITLSNLKLANKRVYLRAMDIFASFLDFEDAVVVAHMERQGITELASYDTDFDRITSIKRKEPALPTAA